MAEVTLLEPEDEAALVDFLCGFPGERRSAAFWQDRLALWWQRNPAFTAATPRGWVLREAGALVGFLGHIPSRMQLAGVVTLVYSATTWRVLPAYRNQSLSLLFAQLAATADAVLFHTTSNAHARQVIDRLRFRPLPAGDDVVSMLPTAPVDALGPAAAELLAGLGLARPPERGQAELAARTALDRPLEVRSLHDTDERFDQLWEATRGQFASANLRSAEALRWYCFASEHLRKHLLGLFDGELLRGFVIAQQVAAGEVPVLRVRDLWTDLGDAAAAAAIDALLGGALAEARRAGCALLHVPPLDARISRRLQRMGAWQGPASTPVERVRAPRSILARLEPPQLYVSGFLGDTGL